MLMSRDGAGPTMGIYFMFLFTKTNFNKPLLCFLNYGFVIRMIKCVWISAI